ncbi:hypothetical protein [Shewanella polaris]|uniref:Lipoprotein n=1 Tax=Shewanella polaris TaxID=2588449 RepID=A0A4Y5YFS8_9GAMM|nr:hypothetical protein [Shewanella polaris]QDE31389.1 hypothetical protein FH971_10640 [Shewanella polaris]
MIKLTSMWGLSLMLLTACSGVSFLGATKYIDTGYYIERWFVNPEYQEEVPEGTAFYGAAADKIKYRYIVKYYIYDGENDDVLIPSEKMWEVRKSDVDTLGNWYVDRFLYQKNGEDYVVDENYWVERKVPIQYCSDDGWCKTYISDTFVYSDGFKYDLDNVLYIKREDIYKLD